MTRSAKPEVDWGDEQGRTYDAVGGFDGKFFDQQWPRFQEQIKGHLGKADFVPVDVSGFTPAQAGLVQDFVDQLGTRVFTVR